MKIARYSLREGERGVLLESEGAYSLIHPWPELGDEPLEVYLRDLAFRHLPLTKRAFEILETEKEAKARGIALRPKELPPSHLLLELSNSDIERALSRSVKEGIQCFKVKIGRNPEREIAQLKMLEALLDLGSIRLRIDVNMRFSREEAFRFFSQLSERMLCHIEFVEDPMAAQERDWQDFARHFDLKIAHDFASDSFREVSDVWILKASRENPWPFVERAAHCLKRIVMTSSHDHALGYVVAAWEAARVTEKHPLLVESCGFLSRLPAPLKSEGASLDFSCLSGAGFGLDSYLKTLAWEHYEC